MHLKKKIKIKCLELKNKKLVRQIFVEWIIVKIIYDPGLLQFFSNSYHSSEVNKNKKIKCKRVFGRQAVGNSMSAVAG